MQVYGNLQALFQSYYNIEVKAEAILFHLMIKRKEKFVFSTLRDSAVLSFSLQVLEINFNNT